MQRYFLDLKSFVEAQYPEFQGNIEGGLYPPPWHAQLISTIAGYVWIAGIALLVAGSSIFQTLGIPEPEFVRWMAANKMGAFFAFFMINNVANSFVATGAFEVYLDDKLIFSKLEMHRMPSPADLTRALVKYGFGQN
jgi:thioredoxin reductase-like selenoprotein T